MSLYEKAGHALALQYGGSGLAHTLNTYNTKTIMNTGKDFFTTVKRYYSNVFTDMEKQHSMNLLLGVFKPLEESVHLWDISSDVIYHKGVPVPAHLLLWFI